MFQFIINLLSSAYIEVLIFILLVAFFVVHRHDKRLVVSGISMLKVTTLLIIFIYFAWMPIVWPSLIPSMMLVLSVFGMFVINFYLLYSVLLAHIERPYRNALAALGQEPEKHEVFHEVWASGKKFYYYHYIFQSLFSGQNPFHFLSDMARDRVKDDIKDTLRLLGVQKKLVSLQLMVGFMKSRLDQDQNLPGDFKQVMEKTVDDLATHPWIVEQVNEFLSIATDTPEDLQFPAWMGAFEKSVSGYKKP